MINWIVSRIPMPRIKVSRLIEDGPQAQSLGSYVDSGPILEPDSGQGDTVMCEIVWMSRKEIDALKEFEGW